MTQKIDKFPGVYLRESDFREKRVIFNEWTPNAQYAWDAGVAIGRYLSELKEGRLIGVHCRGCRHTVIPPRNFCEWCFRPMDDWVYLPDTGTVNTFSLCYVTWDMQYLKVPEISAVIDIDGTTPLVGIMHMLGEVDPDDVKIGMKVQAVWKSAEEREGSILDIKYFKPMTNDE
jgi:uncharacterized OB-fold protein